MDAKEWLAGVIAARVRVPVYSQPGLLLELADAVDALQAPAEGAEASLGGSPEMHALAEAKSALNDALEDTKAIWHLEAIPPGEEFDIQREYPLPKDSPHFTEPAPKVAEFKDMELYLHVLDAWRTERADHNAARAADIEVFDIEASRVMHMRGAARLAKAVKAIEVQGVVTEVALSVDEVLDLALKLGEGQIEALFAALGKLGRALPDPQK